MGDGNVDCALAINQAINSADFLPSSTKSHRIPVQFGSGTYKCNSTVNLVNNITVRGLSDPLASTGGTVLFSPDNVNWPLISGKNTEALVLRT